ncbi:Myc-type [Macleaya cordata]|uniref:Myc-type n=1 Tax=Macleaya cordata TaxID=56857 RepID=A0A200QFM9_MACCD|nr:Myc-type [Macleaya cordata]
MALEAVVFPQDLFGYGFKDLYNLLGGGWSYDFGVEEEEIGGGHLGGGGGGGGSGEIDYEKNTKLHEGSSSIVLHGNNNRDSSIMVGNVKEQETNSSPEACTGDGLFAGGFQQMTNEAPVSTTNTSGGRRKRRRTKSCKNKEEVENQRMTHIAVERNRRRQMNEYLAVLRSLMPPSYVQRGDQASIIGGAINFVKELEQLLQSLEAQKQISKQKSDDGFASPFADFFTFPQYSSCSNQSNNTARMAMSSDDSVAENRSVIADIEVTMVESHANLKILSKRRPKQLLKMVSGFQSLRLTILHLNVTTVDQMVLYSFSVKVEEDCQLTSVDEIATAVYQMIGRIQDESRLS